MASMWIQIGNRELVKVDDYLVHVVSDEKHEHIFTSKYLGLGFWGLECSCGRTIEKKVQGYNSPVEKGTT